MSPREFKDAIFGEQARVAAAFASPKRLEILDLLAQGERRVEVLAREAHLTVANTSRHLQVLKGGHLVEARKDRTQVFYRLASQSVLEGYRALRALARDRLAEVDRLVRAYFHDPDGLEPVSLQELLRRVKSRDVVVLDVRPPEEHESGHISGALLIPLAQLAMRLAEIPPGRDVVAYCRGPYCVLAAEAVRLLREKGFRAFRLDEGYPEWRDAGLPVESRAQHTVTS